MSEGWKACGKFAMSFIAREGSFFSCVLEEGHDTPCCHGGRCFRHGNYVGDKCPHWPTCARHIEAEMRAKGMLGR
jgi:hypothetical protein